MTAPLPGLAAPKMERPLRRPAAAEKSEGPKSERPQDAAPASRDIIPLAAPAIGRASRKFSKFTLLAAALVLAAAFGAMAGVLGAAGVERLAGVAATAEPPPGLPASIAQLQSEVAALRASVDATSRSTGAQYSKLVERFDRVERVQSAAAKTDAALPKDTTGSVTPQGLAAAPVPPLPLPSTVVSGWAVRDVYRGVAMLQSRVGGMVEVEPGDVLPGLGRIESIRRQDGHWVVLTSKGTITSMR
jgi:outer membrane murein-binding lipoprotein Lpp